MVRSKTQHRRAKQLIDKARDGAFTFIKDKYAHEWAVLFGANAAQFPYTEPWSVVRLRAGHAARARLCSNHIAEFDHKKQQILRQLKRQEGWTDLRLSPSAKAVIARHGVPTGPEYSIECERCGAGVNVRCHKPSGHATASHAIRRQEARRARVSA